MSNRVSTDASFTSSKTAAERPKRRRHVPMTGEDQRRRRRARGWRRSAHQEGAERGQNARRSRRADRHGLRPRHDGNPHQGGEATDDRTVRVRLLRAGRPTRGLTNIQDDNFSRTSSSSRPRWSSPMTRTTRLSAASTGVRRRHEAGHEPNGAKCDSGIYDHPEAFNEELRQAAEPLLFPVCIGDATTSHGRDPVSGLIRRQPRDRWHVPGRLLPARDQGRREAGHPQLGKRVPLSPSTGPRPTDGRGPQQEVVYVDVTGVETTSRQIRIGVKGRIRRLITGTVTAQ